MRDRLCTACHQKNWCVRHDLRCGARTCCYFLQHQRQRLNTWRPHLVSFHTVPSPVVECVASSPADAHATPATVIEYAALGPTDTYAAPALWPNTWDLHLATSMQRQRVWSSVWRPHMWLSTSHHTSSDFSTSGQLLPPATPWNPSPLVSVLTPPVWWTRTVLSRLWRLQPNVSMFTSSLGRVCCACVQPSLQEQIAAELERVGACATAHRWMNCGTCQSLRSRSRLWKVSRRSVRTDYRSRLWSRSRKTPNPQSVEEMVEVVQVPSSTGALSATHCGADCRCPCMCVGDTGFNIVNGRHCEVIRICLGYYAGQVRLLHADEDPDNFRSGSWLPLGHFRPVGKRARLRGTDEDPHWAQVLLRCHQDNIGSGYDTEPGLDTETGGNIIAVGAKHSCCVEVWTVCEMASAADSTTSVKLCTRDALSGARPCSRNFWAHDEETDDPRRRSGVVSLIQCELEDVPSSSLSFQLIWTSMPCVSDLCGVDLSWFPIRLFAALRNSRELSVSIDLGFYSGCQTVSKTSDRLLSWFGFCMDNFGSIELPVLVQPLLFFVIQSRLMIFNWVSCCSQWSNRRITEQFLTLSADRQELLCMALSSLSCVCKYFAGWVFREWVNKWRFPPALLKLVRCGMRGKRKCWRCFPTSAGETSVELDDLLVNLSAHGWSRSGNSIATRRS